MVTCWDYPKLSWTCPGSIYTSRRDGVRTLEIAAGIVDMKSGIAVLSDETNRVDVSRPYKRASKLHWSDPEDHPYHVKRTLGYR